MSVISQRERERRREEEKEGRHRRLQTHRHTHSDSIAWSHCVEQEERVQDGILEEVFGAMSAAR